MTSAPVPQGVAADSPAALVRPDDLVTALARFLRRVHDGPTEETLADGSGRRFLDVAAERITTGDVDPAGFDAPYRAQAPERLLSIATGLHDRLDERPTGPAPIVSTPTEALTLGSILLADGAVVAPTGPGALGDPYADLAFVARDLAAVVGPAAVPALFDAAGVDRPDPVRIEFWITLRQLLT